MFARFYIERLKPQTNFCIDESHRGTLNFSCYIGSALASPFFPKKNWDFMYTQMFEIQAYQGGGTDVVSVTCIGVRFSVMFHFMFAHYTFSSVWVAEWPPLGK